MASEELFNFEKRSNSLTIRQRFKEIRNRSLSITAPLAPEDQVVQPIVDVSPPKWHLAHTTWFFETFILKNQPGYSTFDERYNFLFNSYYETIGARTIRTDRGNITRPTTEEILKYRAYVDLQMDELLAQEITKDLIDIIELGLQHEQQHQELLMTDIKYILGHNPIFPVYQDKNHLFQEHMNEDESGLVTVAEGIYEIGFNGDGFCFDNELGRHRVFIEAFNVSSTLVTNAEYLEFIEDGGYENFKFWHAEGWDWVKKNDMKSPMYWHFIDNQWHHYTLQGLEKLPKNCPVTHVSYYEASAFAAWKNKRLLTEFEWEVASQQLNFGQRWEWTNSAYLPYPRYQKAEGAIGEYNGKFMINQMVLRGGSCATPPQHCRNTYRNFFHPYLQWQYTGIRLAENY